MKTLVGTIFDYVVGVQQNLRIPVQYCVNRKRFTKKQVLKQSSECYREVIKLLNLIFVAQKCARTCRQKVFSIFLMDNKIYFVCIAYFKLPDLGLNSTRIHPVLKFKKGFIAFWESKKHKDIIRNYVLFHCDMYICYFVIIGIFILLSRESDEALYELA